MSSSGDNPARQLAAAWQVAAAVAAEWAERTAAVTTDAYRKFTADPAVRALVERLRGASLWPRRDCECSCARSHPDDVGICDKRAVITRTIPVGRDMAEVPLCAPCAVAQGVAEMPR